MKKTFIYLAIILMAGLLATQAQKKISLSESDIIFSHQFHAVDQELECSSCHVEIEDSQNAADDNLPTMDECSACHDVEDDENCGMCHKNVEEPGAAVHVEHDFNFNHSSHLQQGLECKLCHGTVIDSEQPVDSAFPCMKVCMDCHTQEASADCYICHDNKITLASIHPADWAHKHGDQAASDEQSCQSCHQIPEFCVSCHMGDNILGNIHELNFQFTHGLEAQSKKTDCAVCHSQKAFCTTCHESGSRMPLAHSSSSWIARHGRVAKNDPENCAACHDSSDPTCADAGCHNDFDGVRGTNPKIHSDDAFIFETKGEWHDNDNVYCYQCHQNSAQSGFGFCGYCHSNNGEG